MAASNTGGAAADDEEGIQQDLVRDKNMHNLTNLDGLIVQHSNNIEKVKSLMEKMEKEQREDQETDDRDRLDCTS